LVILLYLLGITDINQKLFVLGSYSDLSQIAAIYKNKPRMVENPMPSINKMFLPLRLSEKNKKMYYYRQNNCNYIKN
jgi:hypothetical protein